MPPPFLPPIPSTPQRCSACLERLVGHREAALTARRLSRLVVEATMLLRRSSPAIFLCVGTVSFLLHRSCNMRLCLTHESPFHGEMHWWQIPQMTNQGCPASLHRGPSSLLPHASVSQRQRLLHH
eukprot:GGOE01004579.1.p1 GENE.GGOE01004579.1~~GGOE01004579.1.p1  ORF type:complete len:125 (-),score=0.28 GGOE01004579.1:322-696(-)